jgi:hypothetical protein
MACKDFKIQVVAECQRILTVKLDELQGELIHLAKDIAEDTKSSAGDKFETSREMANIEREKIFGQVSDYKKSLNFLSNIRPGDREQVVHGKLIETNKSWIFLAVSIGPVKVADQTVLVISALAPLGEAFMDKKVKEKVNFNGIDYIIKSIC